MFCKYCGIQLKGTETFCPGCGTKIEKKPSPQDTMTCQVCGAVLKKGVKFCKYCGAPTNGRIPDVIIPLLEDEEPVSVTISDEKPDERPALDSRVEDAAKNTVRQMKDKAVSYVTEKVEGQLSNMTAAPNTEGEIALPEELIPDISNLTSIAAQSLPSLLGGGIKVFFVNIFDIFKDKRKFFSLLLLGAIWAAVNILKARGIDSELLDQISSLTRAEGDLGTDHITRGFVAALFCSVLGQRGFIKQVFQGIKEFFSSFGKGRGSLGGLLLGLGLALLFSYVLSLDDEASVIVSVSGGLLALRALSANGYIRKILAALLPKRSAAATSVLSGWAVGITMAIPLHDFAMFAGVAFIGTGAIFSFLFRGRKESAKI